LELKNKLKKFKNGKNLNFILSFIQYNTPTLKKKGKQMAKDVNHRGKQSHKGRNTHDRSKYWKYGRSSGKENK
jgi:hypothetical protein